MDSNFQFRAGVSFVKPRYIRRFAGLRGREQMLHPELPLWLGGAFHGTQGGACTGLMVVA
jgi:hypothetical protein